MSRVVVNEIEAKVGNDITFNDTVKISTAQIDTVRGKTTAGSITVQGEGTATTNLQQGLAKAFICIDVSATAAFSSDDSFNIASITDNATGNFGITFTNAMKTGRYSAPAGCYTTSGHSINTAGESTSGTSLRMADQGGGVADIDSYATITGTMA